MGQRKIKMYKIFAGIVCFEPSINRLKENIESVAKQVDKVVIYNNGIEINNLEEICNIINDDEKIILIGDGKNKGLSYALNEIMEFSKKNGADWVLTLDQDSIVPKNLVDSYKGYVSNQKIAVICPKVIDKRRITSEDEINKKSNEYVEMCITSASLTRLKAWEEVGRFDNYLFIDLIDNDFCKRLILKKWKILKINSLVLDQEFGDILPKSTRKQNFYKKLSKIIKSPMLSKNISKLSYKKRVSPIRIYYTNRNIIYLNKKFLNYNGIGFDNYGAKTYIGFCITFNLASLVRGKEKRKIFASIVKGIRDGKKQRRNTLSLN